MIADARVLAVIATIALVTVVLRVVPFVALERLSGNAYLRYLGEMMPTGVMVLLVAYTLKDLNAANALPTIGALALSVALYWRTRNSLLSIGLGLLVYLVAVNV